MTSVEHFAPSHTTTGASTIQKFTVRIRTFLRSRSDARRTEAAVRDLSDHIKRDIGLNGAHNASSGFVTEFRHISSLYAW